jgi:integrase
MIKKVFSNRSRVGWRYDSKRRKYWSWKFDIRFADGRRKRQAGFISQEEAQTVLAQIRQAERDRQYGIVQLAEMPTMAKLVAKHVDQIGNRREKVRARRVLSTLCAEISETLKLDQLHSSHLLKFVERRRREGQSPSSINRELNIISSALNAAQIYFTALSNWRTPKIPRPRHSKRRRERLIAREEVLRLLTWLYRPQQPEETREGLIRRRNVGHVFRLALLTASRKGEICKLRWDQIDWAAGEFQIIGTKNEYSQAQTARYPKINETIAGIFRDRREVVPKSCKYVFTSTGGEVTHYYEIIRQAAVACDLLYGRNVQGGFVTHDTRHTAVTYLMQAGCDLKTVGALTGHSDKTMVMLYSHATKKTVNSAYDALESFAGTGTLGLDLDTIAKNSNIPNESEGIGAEGRTRTDMRSEPRQILSLVRIPISPLRHS